MVGKGMVQVAPSVGLLSEGVTTLKAGYKLFEAGMIPVQQGMSQSITAVEKLVGTGTAATTTVAKPSSCFRVRT